MPSFTCWQRYSRALEFSRWCPRNQKFTLEVAAEQLVQVWKVLVSVPAKREKQAGQILRWVLQDEQGKVAEAKRMGMEDVADQAPVAPFSGSPNAKTNAGMPLNLKPRVLFRTPTDE